MELQSAKLFPANTPPEQYRGVIGVDARDVRSGINTLIGGAESAEIGKEVKVTAIHDIKPTGRGTVISVVREVTVTPRNGSLIIVRKESAQFERKAGDRSIPASVPMKDAPGITLTLKDGREAAVACDKIRVMSMDDSGKRTACDKLFTFDKRANTSEKAYLTEEVDFRRAFGLAA